MRGGREWASIGGRCCTQTNGRRGTLILLKRGTEKGFKRLGALVTFVIFVTHPPTSLLMKQSGDYLQSGMSNPLSYIFLTRSTQFPSPRLFPCLPCPQCPQTKPSQQKIRTRASCHHACRCAIQVPQHPCSDRENHIQGVDRSARQQGLALKRLVGVAGGEE